MLLLAIITLVAFWKIFEKAGTDGWRGIIPFYNMWLLAEMVGRPGWLGIVMILCTFLGTIGLVAAMVIQVIIYYDLAKAFGKSIPFAMGLIFLSPVFLMILAFDKSTYSYS